MGRDSIKQRRTSGDFTDRKWALWMIRPRKSRCRGRDAGSLQNAVFFMQNWWVDPSKGAAVCVCVCVCVCGAPTLLHKSRCYGRSRWLTCCCCVWGFFVAEKNSYNPSPWSGGSWGCESGRDMFMGKISWGFVSTVYLVCVCVCVCVCV